MNFGKLLVLLLGLAAVAYAVKVELAGTAVGTPEGVTQPRRQLDNVRARARELETEQRKSVDDALRDSDEQR